MKKSYFLNMTSLLLACMMLVTSMGFSIDLHYCKGELKSFSFFGEAESCHTVKKSCPHHANMEVVDNSKKTCCSNKTINVEDLDVDFDIFSVKELTNFQVQFVASFIIATYSLHPPRELNLPFLASHDPLPTQDIYVLLERFLI